jgi:hypothetical protein
MARGVIHVQWYATVFRKDMFADAVSEFAAPLSLRYGATCYAVHRSLDDRYRITQMMWFDSKDDWYRYWEGPDMIEFRARYAGKYQIPISYVWHDELAADGTVESVAPRDLEPAPEPQTTA